MHGFEIPIDWQLGLAGGLLIGLAVSAMFLLQGRIAGISGILGGALLRRQAGDVAWRWAFVAGLFVAGLLFAPEHIPAVANMPQLVLAGLLVGIGTRMGSGCTSGHGVCGMARLSPRSLVATLTFMASGFVTVFLLRHGGF